MVCAVSSGDTPPAPQPWAIRVRAAWVTALITALCVGAFVATVGGCAWTSAAPGRIAMESLYGLGSCRSTMEGLGALSLARVWVDGEWWRVATTGLLHGSLIHLLLNIWSLWSVGEWAERTWGAGRTALLFSASSIAGGAGSLVWAEAPMVVGASAGVLGLAGALLVARIGGDAATREKLAGVSPIGLGVTLVVLFAIGAIVPVIAQAGHVGGFMMGTLACWAGLQRGWLRLAVVVVLTLGANEVVSIAGKPDGRPQYHEFVGFRLLELGRTAEALAALERALAMSPDDAPLNNAVAYGLALAGEDLDRADGLVDQALADDAENANYVDTKGWIACRRGDVDAGLALLRQAQEISDVPVQEIEDHLVACAGAGVPRGTSE
jgi:membrane associated rhomboid family serine protease